MKKILVTGGCGFIGSNFIRYALKNSEYEIVNIDKLTYAGNLKNLIDVQSNKRYKFYKADICNYELVSYIIEKERIDSIINFAAESHVDRSILSSQEFIRTNVTGTNVLLELTRHHSLERFVQISTDEVYGSLGPDGKFTETSPLSPNSPYSASKASADLLVRAYNHTYGLPALITRCSNNYGPFQFPEKLIPLMIINAINNKSLPVYGDGMNVRDWIYVEDHCDAILKVFEKGEVGEIYNIGAENEMPNIEIVKLILKELGKDESLITFVKDRPGHDRRYAINATKIKTKLNWKPKHTFEAAIRETISWYLQNKLWWQEIVS
ncbi:MAG: dTDP-glucose 4,6-dehydratase, partial [Ignavibacteria bacterium]